MALDVPDQYYSGHYHCYGHLLRSNIDRANYSLIKSMDWFSLVGMAMFLGGLEYFLDEGARHDWLADTGVRIAFMVCIVGGMIFFSRSFTQPKPLLDLSVFKIKILP